jgi:hypothetical protein
VLSLPLFLSFQHTLLLIKKQNSRPKCQNKRVLFHLLPSSFSHVSRARLFACFVCVCVCVFLSDSRAANNKHEKLFCKPIVKIMEKGAILFQILVTVVIESFIIVFITHIISQTQLIISTLLLRFKS